MLKNKSILGSGLNGLVGSRVVELLSGQFSFLNLSRSTGHDITKIDNLSKVINTNKSKVFLHFAARTDVDQIESERDLGKNSNSWKVNVEATGNIAEICKNNKVYLIFISTDYVFDSEKGPYKENDQIAKSPKKIGWYAWTKVQAEKILSEIGVKHSIIRISAAYRSCFDAKTDFARDMIKRYKDGNLYPLFTDRIFNPLYADNLSLLVKALITQQPNEIYHFGCAEPISSFNFGKALLKEYFGREPEIKPSLQTDYLNRAGVSPRPTKAGFIVKKVEELRIKAKSYKEDVKEMVKLMKH